MLELMVVELLDGLTRKLIAGDHIAAINRPATATVVTSETFGFATRRAAPRSFNTFATALRILFEIDRFTF